MKKKLIIIGGPTGIGKTSLSISLAKDIGSEIISCDSRQFFKELNIGVAKPSKEELKEVPHHFIGHKSVSEKYTVGNYEKECLHLINILFKKHNILFLCGGSGLYIDAVCEGLNDFPKIDQRIRENLNNNLQEKGLDYLNTELQKCDKETYNKIDRQNPRRVIRALEIYKSSGRPYSFYIKQEKKKRDFNTVFIALKTSREILYQKINKRVELMFKNGLIEEVENLKKYKKNPALNTIGYKEIFHYFDTKKSIDETIQEIKKNTRRYAKRQITWFKHKKYYQFKISEYNKIKSLIRN